MMRKNKDTELATKTDRAPTGALAVRGPSAWFDEWDRWFDDLRRQFESRFWGPLAPASEATSVRAPLSDVLDTGEEYVVRAELPGVAKRDIDVRVTPDGLEIRAEAGKDEAKDEKGHHYRERAYRSFARTLAFPEEVLADRADAKLKDGVLEVRVPKKEPTPAREPVQVRVE